MTEKYWIKINLHKDGTPLWEEVIGKKSLEEKMESLRKQGYNPRLDNSVVEPN